MTLNETLAAAVIAGLIGSTLYTFVFSHWLGSHDIAREAFFDRMTGMVTAFLLVWLAGAIS